ncbi:acyl-CoA reductase [Mucilaginibacter sp. HMF5004]|uniref:acyl-CoA reductase n=1 Tax=Mucilaginibacter rivuli TaxID=2857527 RepID=UPI001C5DA26C|nr:acyl-CoA reductase [Mucilaginibacter rivuli]MBW4889694.1 acyl-CoA reductase [Mucilaginibacter rivuli]
MSKAKNIYLIGRLSELGTKLLNPDAALLDIIESEHLYNAWFTPESTANAVKAIGRMLNEAELTKWLSQESGVKSVEPKEKTHNSLKVGLILAGNIPLVGFHDVLCVIASGHHALIKASSNDARLIKYILGLFIEIAPEYANSYSFVDRLADFDAVIATGSNNTSRYFEYYFGKVPNIIRKNRNSIALLTGKESREDLFKLGHDIFDYFGLGCRNVSKLLVPKGYDFVPFFESIEPHQPIINHHKYNNNYDYNKSIYLVNGDKHLDNGFLLVKEDERLASPLAVLYFEYYDDLDDAQIRLAELSDNIQCIVSDIPLNQSNQVVGFGESQKPKLWDYADGVDTLAFLNEL